VLETAATAFELVELRRYRTHPGKRDALIALFDREFTETQEACGMVPIGQFRNLDDPDAFVWFRGFPRADQRARALEAFYRESPAWKQHRTAANDTLADSDDVLLLRDARPGSGFDLSGLVRPAGTPARAGDLVGVAVLMLDGPAGEAFLAAFEAHMLPRLRAEAQRVAYLVTDARENDFPALPVRAGEHAFVATSVCLDETALEHWANAFRPEHAPEAVRSHVLRTELLRLEPAPRSVYGNGPLRRKRSMPNPKPTPGVGGPPSSATSPS
jgi:hypothetical protein